MYDADSEDDFQKIWDKLDRFAWVKPEYSDDFHIKITKRVMLDNHCGCFTSHMYITGKIYNKDMSRYRRFNAIVDYRTDDIYEDELNTAYYGKYDYYDDNTYSEFQHKRETPPSRLSLRDVISMRAFLLFHQARL